MISTKQIASRRTREKPSSWWLEYGQRNPIAALTAAALTCGGFILMGFFVRIEFMPDVDLAGSSALLLAAALVGLGTLLAAVLVLVMPSLATKYFLDDAGLKIGRRALGCLALPSVISALLVGLQAAYFPDFLVTRTEYTVNIIVVLVVASALIGARSVTNAEQRIESGRIIPYIERAWALFTCGFVWLVGVLTAMKIALTIASDSDRGVVVIVALTVAWLLFVMFLNAVATQFPARRAWLAASLTGLASLCFLTFMLGTPSTFFATTVRILGFGELSNVDIVVKFEACQALRQSAASSLRCDGGQDGASGVLRNVALRSRIGAQIVVEDSKKQRAGARSERVVFRKDDVVMWTLRGSSAKRD